MLFRSELTVNVIKTGALSINEVNSDNNLQFANYPNPFKGTTKLVYAIPANGMVTIEIHDIVGNKVMSIVDESQTAGDHFEMMEADNLQPGIYTATLIFRGADSVLKRTIKIVIN